MTDTPLQPGPAADALVAKAMGWKWEIATQVWYRGRGDTEGDVINRIPAYTTSGDGLLEMLEWGAARGWTMEATITAKHGAWGGIYGTKPNGHEGVLANECADTAPMAVALALLAACAMCDEAKT